MIDLGRIAVIGKKTMFAMFQSHLPEENRQLKHRTKFLASLPFVQDLSLVL